MTLSAGDTVGRYRIEGILADAEMVQVFKATSEKDGTLVALKVINPDIDDDEMLRRFQREARVAQRVRHPNLVTVLDSGREEGVPFMALRYVSGRTLARMIEDEGPLAFDYTVRLITEVGAGLDALHQRDIMHRDVRSSNVLIDDQGTAALTDFGFARSQADTRITEFNRPVGTLDYRAPELFLGKPATRPSDIYSLGCVAYECLVGFPPFADCGDLIALGRAHMGEPPRDPCELRSETPPEFAASVLTALAKEPGRRPPSGTAYARLLRFQLPSA